jgi:hypothetical protein
VVQSVQRKNFGRNQVLRPSAAYTPSDEQEVLQILDRHNGQRIRAVGRLHSWSEAVLSDDVLLDLRRLNDVQIQSDGANALAVVSVENLKDFLLIRWSICCRRPKHLVAAEILALDALNHASAKGGLV